MTNKQVQGASFGFVLVPEIDMIFGDELGVSLMMIPRSVIIRNL